MCKTLQGGTRFGVSFRALLAEGRGRCVTIAGVGVDLVELDRIRGALERHGERFLDRILTAGEREYCYRRRDPVPHIAARFAAKEAVVKALGTGFAHGIRWIDVEVERDEVGPPRIVLHGAALQIAGAGARVHLSLTHDKGAAVAVAVLES
jgi:holo-[acyl-carrier protein] synthase